MQPDPSPWLRTPELCRHLTISRSTLRRWRQVGILRQGQHWVRLNPCCPRSDHLWHLERCTEQLRRQRRRN